jgi:hypothetical protein
MILLALVVLGASPGCTFNTPEGWNELPPAAGVQKSAVEGYVRENVVVRSWITLRDPEAGTLEEGVRRARAEEQEALGARPDFELVRDSPLPAPAISNRLLVFRYRASATGKIVLRFHAVYAIGFRVVHAVGESQASARDALELPHREAGMHESWMRPAMVSVRCSR